MIRNLRDLGGIMTVQGKKIKKGCFFRSALLNEVDEKDLEWFRTNNITRVYDLRTPWEVSRKPDAVIPGVENINFYFQNDGAGAGVNVNGIRNQISDAKSDMERMAMVPNMRDVYAAMVTNDFSRGRMATLLNELCTYEGGAVLFHCTSGKDRTGMTAALLCSILGVDREAIYDDYLISLAHAEWEAEKMKASFLKEGASEELADKLMNLFTLDSTYLDNFFIEIEKMSGNVENYIKNEMHISDELAESFRNRILE